jgi:periplasmic protein TonB
MGRASVIKKVEPELTPQAQKAGMEGKVVLHVEIGVDGRVYRARVVEELGYGLDAKAMDAVAQWRFSPGTKNGVAVVTPVTIQVWFRRHQQVLHQGSSAGSLIRPKGSW